MVELPVEILLEIFGYLSSKDCQSVSLASHQMRTLTLPLIFGDLLYSGSALFPQLRRIIYQANDEIKQAIRSAFLRKITYLTLTLSQSTETFPPEA